MTGKFEVAGLIIALAIVASIASVLYWMLHPPSTKADRAAAVTETHIAEIIGSIIVVFSAEIHSEHMMALAVRLARREKAHLLAAYIIEVPLTLPLAAEMESEHRQALDVLATAEAIARSANVEIETDIIPARLVSQGVLDLAKRKEAHLLVLGAYREGKYAGAPLGRAIEMIAAGAKCDVLIGLQGEHGVILAPTSTFGPGEAAKVKAKS